MTNPNHTTASPDITQPILREPDALVERIFPIPGTDELPDLESQDVMGTFLQGRFDPEEGPRMRLAFTPSGTSLPAIERIPNGFKDVSRWRKTQEWLITPKTAAIVSLGSLALFNIAGNHDTISGSGEAVGHKIYRIFKPVKNQLVVENHTVTTPGETRNINVTSATGNQVGSTIVDTAVVREFINEIDKARQQGATISEVVITGNTSDEMSNDNSLSVSDLGNDSLGQGRAEAAFNELPANGLVLDASQIKLDRKEHILTAEQKTDLLASAKAEGYGSILDAVRAVDSGRTVSAELTQKIKQLITDKQNRGATLSATVTFPGTETSTAFTTEREIPGKDNPPKVPKPGFYGFIPLLPIRRRERYDKVKQLHKWKFTPSKQLYRPEIIHEEEDQAWVRIRPEAINDDGTFVENAWAYTRKYEHLLRDNRIADMLRADFTNSKGEEKSLRVLFIDQSPANETVEAFEALLYKFAAMEDGKIGNRVSGIFVYPSENAGTDHDDPKRIAMGLDKQSEAEVMGTFTYALDLVELHMPTTWDAEELDTLFKSFNGPAWVAAHEVAGHGTDETDAQLHVRRIRTRNIPNAHIIEGEPRARKMSKLENVLQKLPGRKAQVHAPIEFDISYPVIDNNNQVVTMQARVSQNDPRLAHASHSTIVGHKPTEYADTNVSEHYAETAASVTTGIPVPYDEADITVKQLQSDDGEKAVFATGYRPDTRGQRLFTKSVGAEPDSFPVSFAKPPEVKISHINPANDRLIQREMARTSRLRTLYPNQMIAILARIARSSK